MERGRVWGWLLERSRCAVPPPGLLWLGARATRRECCAFCGRGTKKAVRERGNSRQAFGASLPVWPFRVFLFGFRFRFPLRTRTRTSQCYAPAAQQGTGSSSGGGVILLFVMMVMEVVMVVVVVGGDSDDWL